MTSRLRDRSPLVLVIACALGALASCGLEERPAAGRPAGDKADDVACAGALADDAGVCRFEDGRFAPAACCAVAELDCDALADAAIDQCLPDDEAAVDWPSCLAQLGSSAEAAATCCSGGDFLWCEDAARAACDALDDRATDRCLPDDDAAVDWTACFAEVGLGEVQPEACCELDDYLWCAAPTPRR
jgi:hypothetical protein